MIARISSSGASVGGMTLPGTPRRIVWKTRSSVAPAAQIFVRSGPFRPLASPPWHAAHRSPNAAAPARASCACGLDSMAAMNTTTADSGRRKAITLLRIG